MSSKKKIKPTMQESEHSDDQLRGKTGTLSNNDPESEIEQPEIPDPNEEFSKRLGYVKADYEIGKEYVKVNNVSDVNDENYSICKDGINRMGNYGVGLYLYFLYLKFMGATFFIMSLIMIPAMYCNISGNFYEGKNRSALDFTMLGNQKGFEDGTTQRGNVEDYEDTDSEKNLVIISDLVNTVFFFLILGCFKYV